MDRSLSRSHNTGARRVRVRAERVLELARHLTERDKHLCLFLYRHRGLTTDQLALLFFSSRRRAQDRLLLLHRHRLVDRFYPPRPFGMGKPQAHWLARRGRRAARRGGARRRASQAGLGAPRRLGRASARRSSTPPPTRARTARRSPSSAPASRTRSAAPSTQSSATTRHSKAAISTPSASTRACPHSTRASKSSASTRPRPRQRTRHSRAHDRRHCPARRRPPRPDHRQRRPRPVKGPAAPADRRAARQQPHRDPADLPHPRPRGLRADNFSGASRTRTGDDASAALGQDERAER